MSLAEEMGLTVQHLHTQFAVQFDDEGRCYVTGPRQQGGVPIYNLSRDSIERFREIGESMFTSIHAESEMYGLIRTDCHPFVENENIRDFFLFLWKTKVIGKDVKEYLCHLEDLKQFGFETPAPTCFAYMIPMIRHLPEHQKQRLAEQVTGCTDFKQCFDTLMCLAEEVWPYPQDCRATPANISDHDLRLHALTLTVDEQTRFVAAMRNFLAGLVPMSEHRFSQALQTLGTESGHTYRVTWCRSLRDLDILIDVCQLPDAEREELKTALMVCAAEWAIIVMNDFLRWKDAADVVLASYREVIALRPPGATMSLWSHAGWPMEIDRLIGWEDTIGDIFQRVYMMHATAVALGLTITETAEDQVEDARPRKAARRE